MVGGPSIVFTLQALLDEIFIRNSTNLYKSFVGIDASQFYPDSMCQPVPTGLYTRWGYESGTRSVTPRRNKSPFLRIWSCHIIKEFERTVKLRVMSSRVVSRAGGGGGGPYVLR